MTTTKKLWKINPLSDMWGIGPAMEKKLNTLGMFSVGDVAKHDKEDLRMLQNKYPKDTSDMRFNGKHMEKR